MAASNNRAQDSAPRQEDLAPPAHLVPLQLDSAQLLRRLALAAVQQQLALVLLLQQEDLALRLPRPALEEEVDLEDRPLALVSRLNRHSHKVDSADHPLVVPVQPLLQAHLEDLEQPPLLVDLALAVDLERNQQQQDLVLLTQALEPQRTPALEELPHRLLEVEA